MNRIQIAETLEQRRKALEMPVAALARRSGLSRDTVVRILRGSGASPSLDNLQAIAAALGVEVSLTPISPASEFIDREARRKAKRLVRATQGNVALESQAVDGETIDRLVYKTANRIASSARKLWR